ncbi:metallophosphoesterase [Marinibacterium sp. SX1]|uniref:metallophosphoesterase n=1 Tax=Marinibacterium sp. SX1 TaxID=3388424 RepID=UPI003D1692C9
MTRRPTTFVHLTDLHLNAPRTLDPTLLSDTTATLRRSLAAIGRMAPAPDFVVISGDLTNNGDVPAYQALRAELADLCARVPVIMGLGNHDSRAGYRAVFAGGDGPDDRPLDHHGAVAGVHVIVMDSAVPGRVGGDWEAGQMAWLAEALTAHPDLPKLLVVHHPPMLDPEREQDQWASLTAGATEALRAALAGHAVAGILCGHIHSDRVSHWHGIPVYVGAGHHAETDPLDLSTGMSMTDGAGLAIGTLRDSGLTMTYVAHPRSGRVLRRLEFGPFHEYLARTGQGAGAVEA